MKRNEDSLRDLWDNIKHTNIHIIGVSEEGKKRERAWRKYLEIILENFSHMGKEAQEASYPSSGSTESPIQDKCRKNTLRHILSKLIKN